ncbi:MAG: S49 family peptidase [Polyangiaceae bacterium]
MKNPTSTISQIRKNGARTIGLVAMLSAFVACHGRARPGPGGGASTPAEPHSGPAVALVDLREGLPEKSEASLWGFGPKAHDFSEMLVALHKIENEKDTKGVLVRFGITTFGIARAEELGEALARVRAKKPVICHADGLTNTTMFAAARGCTTIVMPVSGEVSAIGIAAQMIYLRKLLADELHFDIDFLQVGKFKGAEEPLTRDGPSDEARESLETTLSDMRESWLGVIRIGRKPGSDVAAEDGPYLAAKAKDKGLIDEIGYFDEARETAKKLSGATRVVARFGTPSDAEEDDLGDLVRSLAGDQSSSPVVVLRAIGGIAHPGGGSSPLTGDGGITEKEMSRALLKLENDDDVKAVVLRIESPGGSALASDLIWHRLMKLRAKKTLVVSIGDMAASGGYYLASTGQVVYADATSIVGSIGVVGGKVAVGDALELIGVHAETFAAKRGDPKAASRAAMESLLSKWDDDTRARLFEQMTGIYDLFLARVSEGRGLPVAKIAVSAEGRIFTGREGKARGLVDEIGGLDAAIIKARELAKLPSDAKVELFEDRPKLLDMLGAPDGPKAAMAAPSMIDLARNVAPQLVGQLEPFAQALAPVAEGDHVLLAAPYALIVQ